jgi:hypothetical protein
MSLSSAWPIQFWPGSATEHPEQQYSNALKTPDQFSWQLTPSLLRPQSDYCHRMQRPPVLAATRKRAQFRVGQEISRPCVVDLRSGRQLVANKGEALAVG